MNPLEWVNHIRITWQECFQRLQRPGKQWPAFPKLASKKCMREKVGTWVVIDTYNHHVRLLSSERDGRQATKVTRVEELTLLCSQVESAKTLQLRGSATRHYDQRRHWAALRI